jgi:hypothetical protein
MAVRQYGMNQDWRGGGGANDLLMRPFGAQQQTQQNSRQVASAPSHGFVQGYNWAAEMLGVPEDTRLTTIESGEQAYDDLYAHLQVATSGDPVQDSRRQFLQQMQFGRPDWNVGTEHPDYQQAAYGNPESLSSWSAGFDDPMADPSGYFKAMTLSSGFVPKRFQYGASIQQDQDPVSQFIRTPGGGYQVVSPEMPERDYRGSSDIVNQMNIQAVRQRHGYTYPGEGGTEKTDEEVAAIYLQHKMKSEKPGKYTGSQNMALRRNIEDAHWQEVMLRQAEEQASESKFQNELRYNQGISILNDMLETIPGLISEQGQSSFADIEEQYRRANAQATAQSYASGMANPSYMANQRRGINMDRARSLQRVREGLAGQQATAQQSVMGQYLDWVQGREDIAMDPSQIVDLARNFGASGAGQQGPSMPGGGGGMGGLGNMMAMSAMQGLMPSLMGSIFGGGGMGMGMGGMGMGMGMGGMGMGGLGSIGMGPMSAITAMLGVI